MSRTGYTPEQKAKIPEKLEDKTGKLEKRLLLRHIITKALKIRRDEIAELARQSDPEHLSPESIPQSRQNLPQKLTFYDVVQLARQQAMMEKLHRSDEDLIDFSDTPKPEPNSASATTAQHNRDLLELDDMTASQHNHLSAQSIFPNGVATLIPKIDSTETPPAIAELVIDSVQSQGADAPDGFVELPAGNMDSKAPSDLLAPDDHLIQPIYELSQDSEIPDDQRKDAQEEHAVPQPGNSAASQCDTLIDLEDQPQHDARANLEFPVIFNRESSTMETHREIITSETASDASSISTAVPSIFSHSSSITSATASSLPGITEEMEQSLSISSLTSASLTLPQTYDLDKPDEQGYPMIVKAAHDGNEQMICKLLLSNVNINAIHTKTRRHALSEASLQGHPRIVDALIEGKCDLEYSDADGNTALHHASSKGLLPVAKSLVKAHANINAPGPQEQTPLHLALQIPHQNVVMLLVQHGANINARDASSQTPLHVAAMRGNIAMCKYLLEEGAQLDSREARSKTPLQLACEAGYYELVQMMLAQAGLNPTSMTFLSAFFAAVERGHVRIAESFFSHGLKLQELKKDSYKPIILAARSGNVAIIELMVREDCNTDAKDENGWNALHVASNLGHYQVVEQLIASKVSSEDITFRKETPLLLAVKGGHFAAAETLLRTDNNSRLVSAEDERRQQPIHHAVRCGSTEIFGLLISNGGKVNVENAFGWRPLHIAVAYGHLALVERLLQEGASIEEKLGSTSIKRNQTHKIVEEGYWAEARWPYPGSRPLHLACEYGHDDIASYLVGKGAKMEVTCSEGWQPLHHAAYFGSSTLVNLLLDGGVNPHAITNEGKTAQALQFCTHGAPIAQGEQDRIQHLLRDAMEKARKRGGFKVALKKGSSVEDKNNMIRAARFSMGVRAKPPMHRASTIAQPPDLGPTATDLVPNPQRPQLSHLPHTSPLPLKKSSSIKSLNDSPSSHLPTLQAVADVPPTPTLNSCCPNPSAPGAPSEGLTADSGTAQSQPPGEANLSAPSDEKHLSLDSAPKFKRRITFDRAKVKLSGIDVSKISLGSKNTSIPEDSSKATKTDIDQPQPLDSLTLATTETQLAPPDLKLKRRTTFGFAKVNPLGMDVGKLSLGSMGRPAFDIGKQTFDIGKQTLDLGKQGIEIGKQGLEKSRQGLEAIQGLEMGKKGKTGFKKAKKFATRGRGKKGGKEVEAKEGEEATRDGEIEGDDDEDDDIDDGNDDARSTFSLGEFADVGNKDF